MADFKRITTSEKYIGASTDTKPTNAPVGAIAYETDTGLLYMWDGSNWQEYGEPYEQF